MKPDIGMFYGPVDGEPPYQCDSCKAKVYGIAMIRMHQKYNFCDNCLREFVISLIEQADFTTPTKLYSD